jgi:hypothetical protein
LYPKMTWKISPFTKWISHWLRHKLLRMRSRQTVSS